MKRQLEDTTRIALFKGRRIRRTLYQREWWFVVEDVVLALIDSNDPKQYIQRMKNRDSELSKGWVQIVHTLFMETSGGKQKMICANTEGIFRIIQSIPSPKAEPFKRWLLTDEWQKRGAQEQRDYEILTAEISKATFGVTPSQYKDLKRLKRENLRDHMDDLELIFTMLGERSTMEIHRNEHSRGVPKLKSDAKAGGEIAGGARRNLEKRLGRSIVSKKNYLPYIKRLKN
ncbi:MAG: Prophage antirepressor [Microgenomates group bacterium GW2011_GWA2_47_8]|nr:MAG: Prophage antirepressor [Microgenomates group bacterium GW2011_GWA2_47_8]